MKKLSAALLLWLGLASAALAQSAVVVPATTNTIAVAGTTAAITKIISGSPGKRIYLTNISLVPALTSVVTFSTGTGTNCGTSTAALTGGIVGNGNAIVMGTGYGAVLAAPVGNDVCITIGTATAPGSIAYSQF